MNSPRYVVDLLEAFWNGAGVFGKKRENMPEYFYLQEVDPPHRVNVLTVTAVMDYQTNADNLWQAAVETYLDPDTRWVFDFKAVAGKELDILKKTMAVHGFTGRYADNNARYVQRVCRTFADYYGGSPHGLLKKYGYNAYLLFSQKAQLGDLPALTGTKIFPFWLRILKDVAGIQLQNLDKVPIPVDIHTARSTYRIVYQNPGRPDVSTDRDKIENDWFRICRGLRDPRIYPLTLDEPLWFLSREGCSGTDGRNNCPRFRECVVGSYCVFSKA